MHVSQNYNNSETKFLVYFFNKMVYNFQELIK